MPDADYIEIPLRRRDGSIRAYAIVDVEDEHLAAHRWCLHGGGYATRGLWWPDGKQSLLLLHRVVMGLSPGDGLQADHIDLDRLNCRRSNLRVVTNAQNMQNRLSHAGSSSRHRGVSWNKRDGKWLAQAQLNGARYSLGYFDDEEEAAAVVSAWRTANMPFTVEARAAASDASGISLPASRRAI